MAHNADLTIDSLSTELFYEIGKYLYTIDLLSLSLVSAKLRENYHGLAYTRVSVEDDISMKPYLKKKLYKACKLTNKLPISIQVFTHPEQYFWYPNKHVRYAVLNRKITENNAWTPPLKLIMHYPYLTFLGNDHDCKIGVFFLEEPNNLPEFQTFSIERKAFVDDKYFGYIQFRNLVHYLRNLLSKSPAEMAYLRRVEKEKSVPPLDISPELRMISKARLMKIFQQYYYKFASGYWNLDAQFYERRFKQIFDTKKPLDTAYRDQNEDIRYELTVFPKPTWTDHLTYLYLNLKRAKARFPIELAQHKYKYFLLYYYPNLTQIEINDNEHEPRILSEMVYDSITYCQKLKYLKVFYVPPEKPSNPNEEDLPNDLQVLKLINQIKISAKFLLKICLTGGDDRFLYHVDGRYITDLFILTDKDRYLVSVFLNPHILKSIDLTINSLFDSTLNILKNYGEFLSQITITSYSPNPLPVFKEFCKMIKETPFLHLRHLDVKMYLFYGVERLNEYYMNRYFKVFFKNFEFGEIHSSIGQAVKMFRQLKSDPDLDIPDQNRFCNQILSEGISFGVPQNFLSCYNNKNENHNDLCCNQAMDGSIVSQLYGIFAFCLVPMNFKMFLSRGPQQSSMTYQRIENQDPMAQCTHYLERIRHYNDLAYNITHKLPRLNTLVLELCQNEQDIMMLPFLQKLIRYHEGLNQLKYPLNSDWQKIFKKDNATLDILREKNAWMVDVLYELIRKNVIDFSILINRRHRVSDNRN